MTLRPVILPSGKILTVYQTGVFDNAAQTNLYQVFARVTDENGVDVAPPSLLAERLTTNSFPTAQLSLNGVHVDAAGATIGVFIDEPGTYDAATNSYSGDPIFTQVTATISNTGVSTTPVETVLTGPPQNGSDDFLSRLTVMSDGTHVTHDDGFALLTIDANLDTQFLFAFADSRSISDPVEVQGGFAVARYSNGSSFSNPPVAPELEIAFIATPTNATQPLSNQLQAPIQVALPANIFNYQLFGYGINPVDMIQLNNGNFVIAFSAFTNANGAPQGIWMTVVQPDGTVVMAPQVVDDDPTAGRSHPELELLSGGTFVLT